MKRVMMVVVLSLALGLVTVAPALAVTPANNGAGRMYGDHVRTEARAGVLGQDVHPGMHHGFSGWVMP